MALYDLDTRWDDLVLPALDLNETVKDEYKSTVTREMRDYYIGNASFDPLVDYDLSTLFTDRLYVLDIEKAARVQAHKSWSAVYYYYFNYEPEFKRFTPKTVRGVEHMEDALFIFPSGANPPSFTINDESMRQRFLDFVRDFAKGLPPKFGETYWSQVERSDYFRGDANIQFLNIDSLGNARMEQQLEMGPRSLWKHLLFDIQGIEYQPM